MSATLSEHPTETPGTMVSCENCPAVQRLERALEKLTLDFRCEVGYWKSRQTDAVKRIEQLKEEIEQSRGETRSLQDNLFGRKSEKSAHGDRSNDLFDPEEVPATVKKRGAQPGHAGHGRRDYSHLPVQEEFIPLPKESLACPHCGKPALMMSATEDSELLEIEVRPHRRRIRRRRYRATCTCNSARQTLTAPPPPKRIPKGNYGISIWVQVLLDKYSSYRPTERLLGQLQQYDLDLPAGTQELLWLRLFVERPFGSEDVFAFRDTAPLENQSATVADVVLRKLRSRWRKGAKRHPTVPALESLRRASVGTWCANHDNFGQQHILTPLVTLTASPRFRIPLSLHPPHRRSFGPAQIPASTGWTKVYVVSHKHVCRRD